MASESADIAKAHVLFESGAFDRVVQICDDILQENPSCVNALLLRGNVESQNKNYEQTVDYFSRILMIRPEFMALYPQIADAMVKLGRWNDAVDLYLKGINIQPKHPLLVLKLADIFLQCGKWRKAAEWYQKALKINSDQPVVLVNLGNALQKLGQYEDAVRCYLGSLQLKSDSFETLNNLGNAYNNLDHLRKAVAAYKQALLLNPESSVTFYNLASCLKAQGKLDDAIECYRHAIKHHPRMMSSYNNLGFALGERGDIDEARNVFRDAYELQPESIVWKLRQIALWPNVFQSREEISQNVKRLKSDVDSLCGASILLDQQSNSLSGCHPPFGIQFLEGNIRLLKESYTNVFRASFGEDKLVNRDKSGRVGIFTVGSDDGLFLRSFKGVLDRLKSDRFCMTIICTPRSAKVFRSAIESDSIDYQVVDDRFSQMVESIRAANYSVLYYWEVGTNAANYFLPFCRMAPVQCTSWGIQVTSGIPEMDYYLSSELVEPDDCRDHYSEQLLLAHTLLTYQYRKSQTGQIDVRSQYGLRADSHLYVCAQQLGKFHPDFDELIAGILRKDPQGQLLITRDRYGFAAQQLRHRFEETMPDVVDRILFIPRLSPEDYRALTASCDVLLDPMHFSGVNSTYDGLSCNKPIITLPSQFHRGRYTYGCYQKMGMLDCVASSKSDYIDKAVRLGCDADYRKEISDKISEASHQLFEDQLAVTEHERLFGELVAKAQNG